jgi:hypothetical protein
MNCTCEGVLTEVIKSDLLVEGLLLTEVLFGIMVTRLQLL